MPAKTERERRYSPKRGMIILGLLFIGLIVLYINNSSSADYYAKSERYLNDVLLKKMGGP